MVDISSQNNKINVTVSSSGNTANTNVTPNYAQYYSEKSKEWATSNKIVDNTDYSSKYYANESKKQADISTTKATEVVESGNTAVSNIESARDNAITNITNQENVSVDNVNTAGATQVANVNSAGTTQVNLAKEQVVLATNQANVAKEQATIATNKTSEVVASGNEALSNIDTAKNNAITSITNQETTSKTSLIDEGATQIGLIQNEGATQVANVQSTGFYMRDDKLYYINSQGEETEFKLDDIELNNPYSLFDSKYSDHKLNNLSWLKSEGQWNAKAVYPTAYDELLREYNNPDRLATFNKDAFTVVGSPTITNDGVASGFSTSNYLNSIALSYLKDKSWEIISPIISDVASYDYGNNICQLAAFGYGSDGGFYFIGASKQINFKINTPSDTSPSTRSNNRISINKTLSVIPKKIQLKFKFDYTSGTYSGYYNIFDGTGWNLAGSITPTTSNKQLYDIVYNNTNIISIGRFDNNNQNNIHFDLNAFKIYVDGQRVFSGAKSMVKLSTETYTDYDFVLNTAEETFRLPLKTKLASGKAVVGNGMTLGLTNGTLNASPLQAGDDYVYSQSYYGKNLPYNTGSTVPSASRLPLGSGIGVTTDPTKSGIELSDSGLYLYYYVGETVQNANLIDAGRIGEELANKTDMLQASGAGMPSNRYIDLTLGASGTKYTAPANGYFCFRGEATAAKQFVYIGDTAYKKVAFQGTATGAGDWNVFTVPVKKNESILINYNTGANNTLTFTYAEGAQ